MTIGADGSLQVIYWPRWKPFFFRPLPRQRRRNLYRHIYRWIIYLWPVEFRLFRR